MNCDSSREALSARLDGENTGLAESDLTAHLRTCAPCRSWAADIQRLHRLSRVTPAQPVPDLSERIVAAAQRKRPPWRDRLPWQSWPTRRGRLQWAARRAWRGTLQPWSRARAVLLAVAVVQLAVTVPAFVAGPHAEHETAAWSIAAAAGFAAAALRPAQGAGVLPVIAPATVVVTAVSFRDVVGGEVQLLHELPHLLLAAGLLLLLVVREPGPGQQPRRTVLGTPRAGLTDGPRRAA
jgi:predicted anti-sigma-YlaC factor YlaD